MIDSLLKRLRQERWKRPKSARRQFGHSACGAELLEPRALLSVTLDADARRLDITGTEFDDRVTVDMLNVDTLRVQVNDQEFLLPAADVDLLQFQALAGDDEFTNATAVPSNVFGGGGSDTLIGGSGSDTLQGQQNPDLLIGGGGADRLRGGNGDDTLDGGAGSDRLFGQAGNDRLTGRDGTDRAYGAAGIDTLVETTSDDLLLTRRRMTGMGNDRVISVEQAHLTGGPEANSIVTARFVGNVTLDGGGGRDTLRSGIGNDVLMGGDDNDRLDGGSGDDSLHGNAGDDTLAGGGGHDQLFGDAGNDLIRSADATAMQMVRVTTLAPDGPGSLSDALSQGNRRIVFDVAGVIDLRVPSASRPDGSLRIESSNIEIDGSTAPSPGITIIGARVLIRDASDVTIRHVRIRPGHQFDGDALSILASEDVLIQNVSLSWARDELADVWQGSHNVTFDQVLFAEPVDVDGHAHGLLVGNGSDEVTVTRSAFANLRKRAPKFGFGADLSGTSSGLSVNNIVFNPRSRGLIVGNQSRVASIGNVTIPGSNTRGDAAPVEVQAGVELGTALFQQDNYFADADRVLRPQSGRTTALFTAPGSLDNPESFDWNLTYRHGIGGVRGELNPALFDAEVDAPPESWMTARLVSLNVLPAALVEANVLATVGARPWARDATDTRVISQIQSRSGQIINTENEVEGLPPLQVIPQQPESQRIVTVETPDTLHGGDGHDTLTGGPAGDELNGDGGNDHLSGGSGDDQLNGGNGNDTLIGESGRDSLSGNADADFLHGGVGEDTGLWGIGDGPDGFHGGIGSDNVEVEGSSNRDNFLLRPAGQSLRIQLGGESLTVSTSESATIDGLASNDTFDADSLQGFANDYPTVEPSGFELRLRGGGGNDSFLTGSVTDPFVRISVFGGDDQDFVQLPLSLDTSRTRSPQSSNEAFGQHGDDPLNGGAGNERLEGGLGDDVVSGGAGNDTLSGGDGSDQLNGDGGDDILDGRSGDDTLAGGFGRDVLVGGAGADIMQGDADDDLLIAGEVSFPVGNSITPLTMIAEQWTSNLSFATRVSVLTDPGFLYSLDVGGSGSVRDDNSRDTLSGNDGFDWFLIEGAGFAADSVSDLHAGERLTQ